MKAGFYIGCLLGLLFGCCAPRGEAYKEMYAHLAAVPHPRHSCVESDYFLVLCVEARHLDYTNNYTFFRTMAKHPSDGSKNRDVGHAWIYLQGLVDGESICLEGGHSGERGVVQPRYFDGIMDNIESGCANPVQYLWEPQWDGYFEYGPGRHRPTYAVMLHLSKAQFERIWEYLRSYRYEEYVLTARQCSTFVMQVASLAGLELEGEVSMPVEPVLRVKGEWLPMWTDPAYSLLTIASPDILERSMMQAVRQGQAEYALDWYRAKRLNTSSKSFK